MRRSLAFSIVLLLAAALLPGLARAWSDGQPADLVLGQANFTSNATATTQSGMNFPMGVAVDPTTGKVFVADSQNNRVLRFAGLAALSSGANAEGVLGQSNFTSNSAATTQSGMSFPWGIAVDSAGRLWVGDDTYSRVLRFDNAASKANGADADGVLGQPNFTSGTFTTTQSGMRGPRGLALDSAGRLWVADNGSNRVLRFDNAAAKANGANADGVLGQTNFTSRTAATTQSGIANPFGLATDSAGNLWVAANGSNRVLLFKNATLVTISRAGSSPTDAASVDFSVTFSSPIAGLSASNFALTTSGISGASITGVTGGGTTWTVTASTGSGNGTLRLDMLNSNGVQDDYGSSVANVPYTSGESYTIDKPSTDVATSLIYQRATTGIVTFTLTVQNLGPAAADGTVVSAAFPSLGNGGAWNWTCGASGGATCAASGTGDINATLTSFPSGGEVIYTISSTASSWGAWTTTASATAPTTVIDATADNDNATERSYIVALPLMQR